MSTEEVARKLGYGIGRLSMETGDSELFASKMKNYLVCYTCILICLLIITTCLMKISARIVVKIEQF